ncbi:MAG: glycosyltransferase [Anaerolineaceae bacterium]|nr:MAG: glycosyltransferase [Anaerolineaceae bacterium]
MRIGIITGEYPPMQGGVGAYTRIMAHHFADLGHAVHIFAGHQAQEPRADITLEATTRRWNYAALRRIRQWVDDNALDVVNLQFETAAYQMSGWVHLIPRLLRDVPVITTFHDLLVPYLFPKAGRLREWAMMYLASRSGGVIATNHEDHARLSHHPHHALIPIGSNIPDDSPPDYDREAWRLRAGAGDDDFLVAHFGFMNRSKGVDILVEDVARLINAEYPVKLVMIGGRTGDSDGANAAYADEIDALIAELGIGQYVTWTGYVDSAAVSAYLRACDVVALPFTDGASYRRGSLMAAIQHGCAIVTTKPRVEIPAFVDGENMLMARYELISDSTPPFLHVSPGILQLYRDDALRERIQRGARELAAHFQWERIVADTLAFFEKVMKA